MESLQSRLEDLRSANLAMKYDQLLLHAAELVCLPLSSSFPSLTLPRFAADCFRGAAWSRVLPSGHKSFQHHDIWDGPHTIGRLWH